MAEVTAFRNNALPYQVYGVPYTIVMPILDADGDAVTGATGLDSEISKNGDTHADCTNEATEIGSSGQYYLTLTGAEMTADCVSGMVKTSSVGAKTTHFTLYPRKLVPVRSGTTQGGAAGYITLDASAGSLNDRWNGCLCVATVDGNVEARVIDDYDGSNQQASVTPDWSIVCDSDDTFVLYLTEGMQIPTADILAVSNDAGAADNLELACDNYSATRGLSGTALPAAAADAAGGLPISDAGGLDLDAKLANTNEVTTARMAALTDWINGGRLDLILDIIAADTTTDIPALIAALNNLSASQVRTELAPELALIDVAVSSRMATYTQPAGFLAATFPSDPADQSLIIAATDAIATLIGDLPTNAELTTALGTAFAGLVITSGTIGATGNDTTHLHLTGLPFGDDELNELLIVVFDVSTSEYHARWISDWADTGDLATVATLPFTPQNSTDTYKVYAIRRDVTGSGGLDAEGVRAAVGMASANLDTQLADIPTVSEFNARTLPSADYFDPAADTVATVTTLTNLPAITANWLTAAGAAADFSAEILAAIEATTVIAKQAKLDILHDTRIPGVVQPQTGDSFARLGANGAGLTALGDTRIANLDALVSSRATPAQVNTEADTALSDVGVTSARQAHLDADISSRMASYVQPTGFLAATFPGTVASSSEVTAIQNNTRVVRVVPEDIELPTSGTRTYRIELLLYDTQGAMEAPDSAPTIALVNQAGTDRSARLDSATMALVETGRYRAIYTSTAGDTKEQLIWDFSVIEGGATRKYGNTSYVTDAVATDFTSADRTKLERLDTDYTTARAAKVDNLDATISSRTKPADTQARVTLVDTLTAYTGNTPQTGDSYPIVNSGAHGNAALKVLIEDVPTNAELAVSQAAADDATRTDIAAAKVILDKVDVMLVVDGLVWQLTANALELAPTGGSAPTAAQIADEVQTRTIARVTLTDAATAVSDKTGYRLSATGVDDILDEAITEPAGMFSWGTATLRKIVSVLGTMMRNKVTSDSDSVDVRNDADNATLWSYASSDDGSTFTSGEGI